jgi:hypothetical protein
MVWPQVFFRELPVNIFNTLSDDVIHRIARLSVAETIPAMETILEGKSGALIYWLLDLMVPYFSLSLSSPASLLLTPCICFSCRLKLLCMKIRIRCQLAIWQSSCLQTCMLSAVTMRWSLSPWHRKLRSSPPISYQRD